MTWEPSSVFLVIFLVSLTLTLISLAMGVVHISIPHLGHGLHGGHLHAGDGHVTLGAGHGHGPVALGHGAHGGIHLEAGHGHSLHDAEPGLSPFNMATMLAFLTWFGGAGFILTAYFSFVAIAAIAGATLVGLAGAAAVFLFLAKVLIPGQTPFLRPEDYDLEGTVGSLTVGIRAGGTGEMVYTLAGRRFVVSARSEDGDAIDRGADVLVLRQSEGVAYVQAVEDLLSESDHD